METNKERMETNKERKAIYKIEQVMPHILAAYNGKGPKRILLDGDSVNVGSVRLFTFAIKGSECVACGIGATFFAKEKQRDNDRSYHINLYSDTNGKDLLFTQDHIIPKSKGGRNTIENSQPMCVVCNGKKGDKLSLYDDKFRLTNIGIIIDNTTTKMIKPLFNKYSLYSPIEVSHIIQNAIAQEEKQRIRHKK